MTTWLKGTRRMAAVIAGLPDAIVAVDRTATILWVSDGVSVLGGYRARDLVGRNGLDLIDPRDVETAAAAMLRTMEAGGVKQPWPLRIVGRDGKSRWVEMAPTNLLDDAEVEAVLISIRALEGRDAVDAEWRALEELFRRAFDDAPIGIALLSEDQQLRRVNGAFCDLLQRSQLELLGVDVRMLTHADDLEVEQPLVDAVMTGERRAYELDKRFLLPDGSFVWVAVGVSFVRTEDGEARFVLHARDITDRKASEQVLAHRATHDALTGLPNRALFDDRLAVALARRDRVSTAVVVLFCDLDGFKAVNDRLGHEAGDRVLIDIANRLQQAVRVGDTVARLGGDEFVVLCEDVITDAEIDDIVERLAHAVGLPISIGTEDVTLRLSVGRAVSTGSESPAELVKLADAAMYEAKARAPG